MSIEDLSATFNEGKVPSRHVVEGSILQAGADPPEPARTQAYRAIYRGFESVRIASPEP